MRATLWFSHVSRTIFNVRDDGQGRGRHDGYWDPPESWGRDIAVSLLRVKPVGSLSVEPHT
jgi:hypothetical protein